MKFTAIVVSAALAGFAAAQSGGNPLAQLPTCAQSCATSSIPKNCGLDVKCICSTTSFITGVTCCVAKSCNAADQQTTEQFAKNLCSGAGVNNLPTAASCPGSAATTGGSTGSMSSMAATASVTKDSTDTKSATDSKAASVSSSAASKISSASAAVSSGVASASAAVTSAASAVSSAVNPSSTGNSANGLVAQGMGALGVAVAGAIALL